MPQYTPPTLEDRMRVRRELQAARWERIRQRIRGLHYANRHASFAEIGAYLGVPTDVVKDVLHPDGRARNLPNQSILRARDC